MRKRLRILWGMMGGHRLRYALAVAALVLAATFMYFPPLVRMWAVDHLIGGEPIEAPAAVDRIVAAVGGQSVLSRNLWIAGLAIVSVTAVSGALTYLKGRWSAIASEAIARSLRERLYDHLQHLPCRYHDGKDTGDLVQRCSSDVETLRMFLATGVTEVGRAVILLMIGLPIMWWVHPSMTVASMVLMPPIAAYSVLFFILVRRTFKQSDEAEGRMTAVLEENLTGIRVVRAFARGEHEKRKFAEYNTDYRRRWYRVVRLFAWFWSVSDLMCMSQVACVLVYGVHLMIAGRLTAGGLFAFMSFVHMFMWPIRYMGRVLADFGKATVALDRIHEVLDQPREDGGDGEQADAPAAEGEIVVENLTFAHDSSEPVLRDVSFRVEPGQTLAVLGPSGSGKSTLVNLLLRLYDYETGSIRLDGRELAATNRKEVRRQFGAVLQEPFLYSKTVGENIRLGSSSATEEAIAEAATAACVHEAILEFDKGYDTVVGERGVTLSGGQRQRVALARAVLADPPVLILDDALSAVDTRTEAMILDALRRRHGRRTTLIIAHRLTTLMQADRILVFDDGRIVQSGTHETLVGAEGLYGRLWQVQSSLEADLRADAGAAEAASAGKDGP